MIMINDVRRAYLEAQIQRDVHIEFPKETQIMAKGFWESLSFAFMAHVTQPRDGKKL